MKLSQVFELNRFSTQVQGMIEQYPLLKNAVNRQYLIKELGNERRADLIPEDLEVEMSDLDIETIVNILGRAELKRIEGMNPEDSDL